MLHQRKYMGNEQSFSYYFQSSSMICEYDERTTYANYTHMH